jgi:hypothetical protein
MEKMPYQELTCLNITRGFPEGREDVEDDE